MGINTKRIEQEFQNGVNTLPASAKNSIGTLTEDKSIDFKDWRKSIVNALTFLDNDYDLGMPGDDKKKQIFKDNLINKIGNCKDFDSVSKILKKVFPNKEILVKIMEKAYLDYESGGLGSEIKDESTGASSSGSYVGPLFGGEPKNKSNVVIKRNEIERIVKETLDSINADESTTSSSSGAYVGPAIWAKNKENWRGKIKTWKGGKFVNIKEKCKKFPYCNESPSAINLTNVPLDRLDNVFEEISKKTKKPYSHIKRLFFTHFDVK